MGAVKTVGQGAVDAIIRQRKHGAYRDIFDFCRRIDTSECNKRVVESLIKAGAFDGMGGNRPQLLAVFESAMDANSSLRKQTVDGQISLFDMAFGGAPLVQENHTLPNLPDYPLRQRLALEKEIAGVYITGHPLDDYRDVLGKLPFWLASVLILFATLLYSYFDRKNLPKVLLKSTLISVLAVAGIVALFQYAFSVPMP